MSNRQALALSFLDRYAGLVLAVLSSMLIARLLTPAEIGVFSVVMVLVSLVSALRDFGAGQYLLQEKDLSPQRLRATWTVLLLAGLGFAALVALAALPMARFYDDPRMLAIMGVLALNFAVNPVASLSYAWLMREMRFGALASMRLSAGLATALTSVWLAWRGWGPISLALGSLAGTVLNAVVALYWRPPELRWWPSLQQTRRVLSFGSRISTTSLVGTLGNGAPELLLGKLQGLAEAAYYSRAAGLSSMFQKLVLDATQSVALPAFAREMRAHGRLGASLPRAMASVTLLGWVFFGATALLAQPLVLLLYGDQWNSAVPLARWLALAMAVALPATMIPVALSACGAARQVMRTTLQVVAVQIGCMALAAANGMHAVGPAALLGQAAGALLWLLRGQRDIGFSWAGLWRSWWQSARIAGVALLAPAASVLLWGWTPQRPLLALGAALAGMLVLLVLALLGSRHPLREELLHAWGWLATRWARQR
jgi:O-antigen/teichoic acid export membrane protein